MREGQFEATYLIETPLEPTKVAEIMAGEQSCGTFTRVEGETDALRLRARATVKSIEELASVTAPSRAGSARIGSEGCSTTSSGVIRSTTAPAAARSASVSPGRRVKVPQDCSPAITSATRAGSSGVSIR